MISDKNKKHLGNVYLMIMLISMMHIPFCTCFASTALSDEVMLDRRWRDLETSRSLNFNPSFSAYNERYTGLLVFSSAQLNMFNLYNAQITAPFTPDWNWGLTAGLSYTGFWSGDMEQTKWQNGNHVESDGQFNYQEHYFALNVSGLLKENIVNKFLFFKDIAFGINLNGGRKSNYGNPINDMSMDLGISFLLRDTTLLSRSIIGLSFLNPFSITRKMYSSPLFTPDLGLSYHLLKNYRDITFNGGIEFDWRSFWDYSSNYDRKDISLRVGARYRFLTFYLQSGFGLSGFAGNNFWGSSLQFEIPSFQSNSKNNMIDLGEINSSLAFQFIGTTPDEHTAQPTNSGFLSVEFGKFECGPFDTCYNICDDCDNIYLKAKQKLQSGEYWEAYGLFYFFNKHCTDRKNIFNSRYYASFCIEKLGLPDLAITQYKDLKNTLTQIPEIEKQHLTFNNSDIRSLNGSIDLGILRCTINNTNRRDIFFKTLAKLDSNSTTNNTRWIDSVTVNDPDSAVSHKNDSIISGLYNTLIASTPSDSLLEESHYYYSQYQISQGRSNAALETIKKIKNTSHPLYPYAQYLKAIAFIADNGDENTIYPTFSNSIDLANKSNNPVLKNQISVKKAEYAYELFRENMSKTDIQSNSLLSSLTGLLASTGTLIDSIIALNNLLPKKNDTLQTKITSLKNDLTLLAATINIECKFNTLLSDPLLDKTYEVRNNINKSIKTLDSGVRTQSTSIDNNDPAIHILDHLKTLISTAITKTDSTDTVLDSFKHLKEQRNESRVSLELSLTDLDNIPESSSSFLDALLIKMWIQNLTKKWDECFSTTEKVFKQKRVNSREIETDARLLQAATKLRNMMLIIIRDHGSCDSINIKDLRKINNIVKSADTSMNELSLFVKSNNTIQTKIDTLHTAMQDKIKYFNEHLICKNDFQSLLNELMQGRSLSDALNTALLVYDKMSRYTQISQRFTDIQNDLDWVKANTSKIKKYYSEKTDIQNIDEEINGLKQELEDTPE